MGMIEELVEAARAGVERRRAQVPLEDLGRRLPERPEQRPFGEALDQARAVGDRRVQAPLRRARVRSATAQTLAETSRAYEQGGAAALSVLTDEPHFGGSLADLTEAREACELPVLQKDFIVDRYQLYEAARGRGGCRPADRRGPAIARTSRSLHSEASGLDLDCMVEVHTRAELETALAVDADVIGINNRNLEDFRVDVQTTFELMPDVPAGKTVVSESGISDRATLEELERVGVDAVLIGEALMRADDPAARSGS